MNKMLRNAILIKKITNDGLVEIQDDVKIGRSYTVDDRTIRVVIGFNQDLKKKWIRLIVDVADDEGSGWFPTELLKIE